MEDRDWSDIHDHPLMQNIPEEQRQLILQQLDTLSFSPFLIKEGFSDLTQEQLNELVRNQTGDSLDNLDQLAIAETTQLINLRENFPFLYGVIFMQDKNRLGKGQNNRLWAESLSNVKLDSQLPEENLRKLNEFLNKK